MMFKVSPAICEQCFKRCEDLRYVYISMPGFDADGLWLCPECKKNVEARIKKRYRTAGEHTEPAE